MKIELENSFENSLKEGVNLFLGAGFSILASDIDQKRIPLGNELCKELIEHFSCPPINDLSKLCTIIRSQNSDKLDKFLRKRFDVKDFDKIYLEILKINAQRIFTTNIDNLSTKIFEKSKNKYLKNIFLEGMCFGDNKCVEYIPLHGTVEDPDSQLLFNKQEVSSSFRTVRNGWASLTNAASQFPSIFLGYSLEDVGAIESLFGDQNQLKTQKNKWILLYEPNEGTKAYFKALGFNIIVGNIKDFLEKLKTFQNLSQQKKHIESSDSLEQIFPQAKIKKSKSTGRVRSIDEFYLGSPPIWSDIQSNRIATTSHLAKIIDLVESGKNLIVTGIPASGKTTLKLQLASKLKESKRIFMFENLSENKAKIITYEVKSSTVVLVDNYTTNLDAFLLLNQNKNIILVGFDRYFYVDMSSHFISNEEFNFYDVSDLSERDIQSIYESIPLTLRQPSLTKNRKYGEHPSIFEIVNYNIKATDISKRYGDILKELNEDDPDLLDLLLMACYLHSCRTPLSFEVASSFLNNNFDYDEVIEMINSLKGLLNEAMYGIQTYEFNQDYYEPRSQILAETIIEQANHTYFARMYITFHEQVPKHQIPDFNSFKRRAYDSFYTTKAFKKWEEGEEFYDTVHYRDNSPFLLQQCAIFLMKKNRFYEAAIKIDKAIQSSHKRFFSIENTHAIILFKANINSRESDPNIRTTLDKSMDILKKCYMEDKRKTYHAITFAEQSIAYYSKFPDKSSLEYLSLAKEWLRSIQIERKWNRKARKLREEINNIL